MKIDDTLRPKELVDLVPGDVFIITDSDVLESDTELIYHIYMVMFDKDAYGNHWSVDLETGEELIFLDSTDVLKITARLVIGGDEE